MATIEHFALFAPDPAALKDFYVRAFGLRVVLDNGHTTPPGYFLADDRGGMLEIIGRDPSLAVDTRHVCHLAFTVDDVAASRSELESHGFTFEPDTAVDSPTMQTAFFRDPAGNRCQIVRRPRPLTE